jgi:hypothetical protein
MRELGVKAVDAREAGSNKVICPLEKIDAVS